MSNTQNERAEEYRTHADRIRQEIANHKNPVHRAELEEIAKKWDQMAFEEEAKVVAPVKKP